MLIKLLKFIAQFLRGHLHADAESLHNALKGMSYSQAAIAFSLLIKDTSNQSPFMSAFALIFPIFIVQGAIFGIMSQQKNKNGNLLVVAIFIFLLLTALHFIFISIFFLSFNKAATFTFLFSVIAILYIFGWGARLYANLSDSNNETK